MADNASSIFNKKASEKLKSPDDLEKFIRVTNPSVWVVLVACVALLLGLLAWGIFGTVTTSVSATATCVKGEVVCFLDADDASKVSVGDTAVVDGKQMEVSSLSAVPVSRDEAKTILSSDYLVSSLVSKDWAYVVHFKGDGNEGFAEGVPLTARITTERIAPIRLILRGGK